MPRTPDPRPPTGYTLTAKGSARMKWLFLESDYNAARERANPVSVNGVWHGGLEERCKGLRHICHRWGKQRDKSKVEIDNLLRKVRSVVCGTNSRPPFVSYLVTQASRFFTLVVSDFHQPEGTLTASRPRITLHTALGYSLFPPSSFQHPRMAGEYKMKNGSWLVRKSGKCPPIPCLGGVHA